MGIFRRARGTCEYCGTENRYDIGERRAEKNAHKCKCHSCGAPLLLPVDQYWWAGFRNSTGRFRRKKVGTKEDARIYLMKAKGERAISLLDQKQRKRGGQRMNDNASISLGGGLKLVMDENVLRIDNDKFVKNRKVGPEEAKTILQFMDKNRKVKESHVEKLAREIRNGNWKFNGDTIKFSGTRLIDGQHRLLAIIKANACLDLLFVFGCANIDDRKARTVGDQISIDRGMKDTRAVAALAGYHMRLLCGMSIQQSKLGDYTHREIIAHLDDHPELIDCMKRSSSVRYIGFSKSITAAIRCICENIDKDLADSFFKKVIEGVDIEPGDIEGMLRERFIRDMRSLVKTPSEVKAALMIKAWNIKRSGTEKKILIWRSPRGDKKGSEAFPVIR